MSGLFYFPGGIMALDTEIQQRITINNDPAQSLVATSSLLEDPMMTLDYGFWYGALVAQMGATLLPPQFDDALVAFGSDLYWRMMLDPQVFKCIMYSVRQACAENITVATRLPKTDPDYDLSLKVVDFIEHNLGRPRRPLREVLIDMGKARGVGHRVAMPIYDVATWQGADYLMLSEVRVKPQESYGFLVDRFRAWAGLVALRPGGAFPSPTEVAENPRILIPEGRYWHQAWDIKDHDPRGTSLCRPVYGPWWFKQQLYPAMLANAATFAQPGILVKAAASTAGVDFTDPATGAQTSMRRINALVKMARAYRNGGILGISMLDDAEVFQAQGDGQIFPNLINLANMEISNGITSQTQATEAGGSRAQAYVHADVIAADVIYTSYWLSDGLRDGLVRPLVMYNDWGLGPNSDERKARLIPSISLGEIMRSDFPQVANAIAQLTSGGWMTPSERPYWAKRLGSPGPTADELEILTDQMKKLAAATPLNPQANQTPAPEKVQGAQPQREEPPDARKAG